MPQRRIVNWARSKGSAHFSHWGIINHTEIMRFLIRFDCMIPCMNSIVLQMEAAGEVLRFGMISETRKQGMLGED